MRYRGLVYRAHHPGWAFQPDSGEGASLFGGRFNPRGMPALYCAQRLETAWLEAQQGFAFKAQPMTICTYDVDCHDVVDLTQAAERDRLGIDKTALGGDWEAKARRGSEPATWSLARRLFADGAAGLVVSSFAPGAGADDINLVFWRWSVSPPHRVAVIDDHGRLPRDGASWR